MQLLLEIWIVEKVHEIRDTWSTSLIDEKMPSKKFFLVSEWYKI